MRLTQAPFERTYPFGPPSEFRPGSVAGMFAWYDAADARSLYQDAAATIPATDAFAPIGAWRDRGPWGRHLAQATSGKRPSLLPAARAGMPAVEFDGVDDALSAAWSVVGVSAMTLFVAFRADDSAPFRAVAAMGDASGDETGTNGWRLGHNNATGTGVMRFFHDRSNATNPGMLFPTMTNGAHCVSLTLDCGTGTLASWTDGASPTNDTFVAGGAMQPDRLSLGAATGGSNAAGSTLDVYEAILYAALVPTADRQRVEGYLKRKWGL